MLLFPGSSQQSTLPPTVDTQVGLCHVLGSSEKKKKKKLEPDIFKTLWLKYPSKIFSLCFAQCEVTMACNATRIQSQRVLSVCQVKVFCLSGEKSDIPSKVAVLCEEGEAEDRVIDHIISTAFRKTQLKFDLREGTTLRSGLWRLYNFIEQ